MTSAATSFPRRQAVTRRFTLGAPRDVRVGADGRRVAFLRSEGPEDPSNRLWVFDVDTATERLVVDPVVLGAEESELPTQERARRERARESGGGIVAFDADRDLTMATFALGGEIGRVDLTSGEVEILASTPGAFDPRLSPDGTHVGYVAADELRVVDADGDRVVIAEEADTVSWGSAEFVAGEEMGRTRGFWWAPGSDRLLVQRVDVAPIEQWWIAAPITPQVRPVGVRYPAAGTANADVALAILGIDGTDRIDVAWNDGEWEYLADAAWTSDGLILTVQSRDQRTLAVLDIDPIDGSASERHRITDQHWVELVPGTPRLHGNRLITVEDRGEARRLCVDATALTGDTLQIRRVVHADDRGILVIASTDPTTSDIVTVGWDGHTTFHTHGDGVHGVAKGGSTDVRTSRRLSPVAGGPEIYHDGDLVGSLADHSERPALAQSHHSSAGDAVSGHRTPPSFRARRFFTSRDCRPLWRSPRPTRPAGRRALSRQSVVCRSGIRRPCHRRARDTGAWPGLRTRGQR